MPVLSGAGASPTVDLVERFWCDRDRGLVEPRFGGDLLPAKGIE